MNFKDFLNEKVKYMNLNQLKKQLKKDYGSKASSLKIVKVKGGVSIQTPGGQELERYNKRIHAFHVRKVSLRIVKSILTYILMKIQKEQLKALGLKM